MKEIEDKCADLEVTVIMTPRFLLRPPVVPSTPNANAYKETAAMFFIVYGSCAHEFISGDLWSVA